MEQVKQRKGVDMNTNIEVIGIDHGWSQMKTSSYCFNTSIKRLPNEPAFYDNVLEYNGRYYAVGEDRLEMLESKVDNENFYLLTLVAIAKELKSRGKLEADVLIAAGLPLTRFSAERKTFIEYLSQKENVAFSFEQKLYKVHIVNVSVYPQCYAAVAGMLQTFGKKVLVVDVGSWTVDSMLVVNKRPDNSKCDTQNEGLIKCMRSINRESVQIMNHKIDESDIQEYMMTGRTNLPMDYKNIMDQQIREFVDKVYRYQMECGYNLDMIPVYFVGGGAVVMRNFGEHQGNNIHYVLDVKANAKRIRRLQVMLHEMRLKPDPFEGIEAGKKKIEFRLWDEKRRLIKPGDKILFTNTDTGQNILTYVVDIHKADSFVQLKEVLVKKNLIEENDFEPSTMLKYYSSEEEKEYGVVGVEIALLSD